MTIIKGEHLSPPIEKPADIRPFYEGVDTNAALDISKIGIEIEFSLCQNDKALSPLTRQQNAALVSKAKTQNLGIRQEPPTTALELASDPYQPAQLNDLASDVASQAQKLAALVAQENCILSPFGHLPHIPLSQKQVIDSARYEAFFVPPREDMVETYRFFTSCMNIQTSVSYQNADHLLRIIRMATALEPIIFLSTDSSCGFFEGQPIDHIQNIAQKDKLGINAGIPDFYYSAKSGAELIDAHIDFTFNNPHVFAVWNEAGELTRLPKGQWSAYKDIKSQGHGPLNLTNYLQAQSESWRRACNIATIVDGQGQLIGHRAEIGAFQNGLLHQNASALLLTYLIAYDEEFYAGTQDLLMECGIDLQNLDGCKKLLKSNFKAACYHKNQYHALPFGTKALKDFALPFAQLILARASKQNLSALAGPLTHILQSGKPDWLVYRQNFPTLERTTAHLKTQAAKPQAPFTAPLTCADQIINKSKAA